MDFGEFCAVIRRYRQTAAAADAQQAFKVCRHRKIWSDGLKCIIM